MISVDSTEPGARAIARVAAAARMVGGIAPIYLVGGAVRDLLLGRPSQDVDLTLPSDPIRMARDLADRLGGSYFVMHEAGATCRVVFRSDGDLYQVDVSRTRGSLDEDLRSRDFTVNAMALPLRSLSFPVRIETLHTAIVDPAGGLADLESRRLRCTSPTALDADPLRLLRAVRLSATLGFRLTRSTAAAIRGRAATLARVSAERVRDELFLILERPDCARWVRRLRSLDLLTITLPSASDLWQRDPGLRGLRRLIGLTEGEGWEPVLSAAVQERERAALTASRSRAALLRLVWLLAGSCAGDEAGDIGDPPPEERVRRACDRLRLSGREMGLAVRLVEYGPTLDRLYRSKPGDRPSPVLLRHRFFRDAGDAAPEVTLFWLARDRLTQRRHRFATDLLQEALDRGAHPPAPIITAQALIAALSLKPGPVVGDLLRSIEEARAEATISSADEAIDWAHRWLKEPRSDLERPSHTPR